MIKIYKKRWLVLGVIVLLFMVFIFGYPSSREGVDITGMVVSLQSRIDAVSYSENVEVSGLSFSDDGFDVSFTVYSEYNDSYGSVEVKNLSSVDDIGYVQSGFKEGFATDVVFVEGEGLDEINVKLPLYYGGVDLILTCAGENWDENALNCSRWEDFDISFSSDGEYVEFTVKGAAGWTGFVYTRDNFEGANDYCFAFPPGSAWAEGGKVCEAGAGNMTGGGYAKYMQNKGLNVTKLNSEDADKNAVYVYDQQGGFVRDIRQRVYLNIQSIDVTDGINATWNFMGFGDGDANVNAFMYFDENETLGCGYYNGSGAGTLSYCAGQTKQNLTTGSWYWAEIRYNDTGIIECWLNSTKFCNQQTGIDFDSEFIRYNSIGISKGSSVNATGEIWFDEYLASDRYIGGYPNISDVGYNGLTTLYDDQIGENISAIVTDYDGPQDIDSVYLEFLRAECFPGTCAQVSTVLAGSLSNTTAADNYTGIFHEMYFSKSATSSSYVVTYKIYANDTAGELKVYTGGNFTVVDGNPNMSLTTVNNTNFTTADLNFTCNVSDHMSNLKNISLYTNMSGSFSEEQTTNISANGSVTFNITATANGDSIWNCLAYDQEGNLDWENNNFTFNVSVDPIVNLSLPANDTTVNNDALEFYCNVSYRIGNLTNVSLYTTDANGVFHSRSVQNVTNNESAVNFTLQDLTIGDYVWNCLTYDAEGRSSWAATNYSYTINLSVASSGGTTSTDGGKSAGGVDVKTYYDLVTDKLYSFEITRNEFSYLNNINFKVKEDTENLDFEVKEGSFGGFEGEVYEVFDIETDNDDILDDIFVYFSVEVSWLDENDIDKNEVVLYEKKDDWIELDTYVLSEVDGVVNYYAELEGLSSFLIGVREEGISVWEEIEETLYSGPKSSNVIEESIFVELGVKLVLSFVLFLLIIFVVYKEVKMEMFKRGKIRRV